MTNETNGTPRDENAATSTPQGDSNPWNSTPQGTNSTDHTYGQAPSTGYTQSAYGNTSYDANTQGQGYTSPTYGAPASSDGQGYGGQPYTAPAYSTQPPVSDQYAGGYGAPQQPYGQPGYGAAFGSPAGGYMQGYGTPMLAPASFGRRVKGWLLNWFVGGFVLNLLSTLIFHPFRTTVNADGTTRVSYGSGSLPELVTFAILAVGLGLLTRNGQAPGNRWAKTQIVDEMGRPVSGGKAVIRNLAHYVDNLICGIGWLFPLWDAKRQTLADKIMKTTVVDVSQTGPIS